MKFLEKLKSLIRLPSPVDLGWSSVNALEDEDWSDDPQGKTWQDWHRHVKELHPVKYWFRETLTGFVKRKIYWPIKHPVEKAHYWLVSHVVLSRRYHMLDLRQLHHHEHCHPHKCYHYGWVDVPDKMLFAIFNLLGEYLNGEKPYDLSQHYSKEQIDSDGGMKNQQANLEEAKAIYHWWTVGRDQAVDSRNWYLNRWSEAKKNKDPRKEYYWDKMKDLDAKFEEKDDEMIARLMRIRRTLWT